MDSLGDKAMKAINEAVSLEALESLRVAYLGKKGSLTQALMQLGSLAPDERRIQGQALNQTKQALLKAIKEKQEQLALAKEEALLAESTIDVTLPGKERFIGHLHPVTCVRRRLVGWMQKQGFSVVDGAEVQDVYHNFEALNIAEDHPAREDHDTFYLQGVGDFLLRTQTSSSQIHVMKAHKPPYRIVSYGRVFRRDSDQTHTPMFHQMEGLVVNKTCNFRELKSFLHLMLSSFFGREVTLRFRPSFFPFTEPSAEVDLLWTSKDGSEQWLEVMGCGMVHPDILKRQGMDPDEYIGYAFGVGLDRLAMLYYGIDDLRLLFKNEQAFLEQFETV